MELNKGLPLKKQKSVEIQETWAPTTPAKTTPASIQKGESLEPCCLEPVAGFSDRVHTTLPLCELACRYGSSGLPEHLASSGQATTGSIVMLHTPATTSSNSSSMGPLSPHISCNKNAGYILSGLNKVLMRFGNGLEMPANSNIFVLNANSFLSASPFTSSCSSNQPDRLPVTNRPNLYAVPNPVGASMAVVMFPPSTPATIEKCNRSMEHEQIPLEFTNFDKMGAEEENLSCTKLVLSQLPIEKFAKDVMVLDPSNQFLEVKNCSTKRENDGIDWNVTPTKKPRRRKHRPKVVIDGKPSGVHGQEFPLTERHEQVTQSNYSSSCKRTYVRRKKDSPAGPVLNALEKNDLEGNRLSARRCLKFDSAEHQTLNELSAEGTMFKVDGAYGQELCHDITAASSFKLQEQVTENSHAPIVSDLNIAYRSENECHKMLSSPILSAEVNKTIGCSQKQMTSLKFSRKKLKELAREKACTNSERVIAESYFESAQNNLNSDSISNPKPNGTIRDQLATDEAWVSVPTNFTHSLNLQDCLHKICDSTKHDSSILVKKKRTKVQKKRHTEATSDFSLKYGCIPSGWKLSKLSNTMLKFTFTNSQSFMTKEKMLASKNMLSFKHKQKSHDNPALVSRNLSSSSKPFIQNNMGFLQQSTPEKLSVHSGYLEKAIVNEAHLIVSDISNNFEKAKKRRGRKKQHNIHSFKFTSSRIKHASVQMLEDAYYVAGTPSQPIAEGVFTSGDLTLKNTLPEPISVGCQSTSYFKVITHSSFSSGALITSMDGVDDIIHKLKFLSISRCSEVAGSHIQHAVVPYFGHGGMIDPYVGNFDMIKKRRPRAKVDLDPESNRVWNLLMGKEVAVGDERTDVHKESWWNEERRVFQGRVDSFIARMRLVQGDRRFSQWKGSVVDSVVGVFLTQNVSDHLSSSAFMALAANFPLQPRGKFSEPNGKKVNFIENVDQNGASKCTTAIVSCCGSSLADYCKENANFNEKLLISDHKPCSNAYGTVVTATENTSLGDTKDVRDLKDVISTQNSVVSGPLSGNLTNGLSSSSFTELLQMAEHGSFQEFFINGSGTKCKEAHLPTENCVTSLNKFGNSNGTRLSFKANSSPHLGLLCSLNVCPPKSCQSDDLSDSNFMKSNANWMADKTRCHSPSTKCEIIFQERSKRCTESDGSLTELSSLHNMTSTIDLPLAQSKQPTQPNTLLEIEASADWHYSKETKDMIDAISTSENPYAWSSLQNENMATFQNEDGGSAPYEEQHQHVVGHPNELDSGRNQQTPDSSYYMEHKLDMNEKAGQNYKFHSEHKLGMNAISTNENPHTCSSLQTGDKDRSSTPNAEQNQYVVEPPVELDTGQNQQTPDSSYYIKPRLDLNENAVQNLNEVYNFHSDHKWDLNAISTNENTFSYSSLQSEDMTVFHNKDGSSALNAEQNQQVAGPPDEVDSGRNKKILDSSYCTEHTLGMNEKVVQDLNEVYNFQKLSPETPNSGAKKRKRGPKVEKSAIDWEGLRKKVCSNKPAKERSDTTMDSLDWEAVRSADVRKIADTIRERGMNNVLAERIQEFLNRLVREHGNIDLEWLRDVPPDTAKDYLLSIRGLGLKSAECVRLLTLQHLAFPVDTNVGRICVRLGWVPLQPLPESLQLHLLELYPVLESIQKYLWPRLCKLDQRTLYELHYQMITFGKVFCTKSKPNCNACPLRSECKHFASAFASARLALPAPKEKGLVSFTSPIACEKTNILYMNPCPVPGLEGSSQLPDCAIQNDCIPIVEEPESPEPEYPETLESEIEDAFYEDPDEIPIIKLNLEEFTQNLQDYMQENMEIQDGSFSKALIALTPEAASIPMPKLKNVSRLRTEHQVYELPDSHPLLNGVDPREPDDPSPYLLAIWTPGETAQSTEPPKACCDSQNMSQLCDKSTCFACSSVREAVSHKVRGTLLIPCRTAMRGSFPLNGTYFQVNEVFADHHSSCNPIDVPRDWIWNLPRRTVYFGTSIPTIFRGLTTEGIQQCFWRGFVCVRGFDRVTGAPKPLYARLHFPASKAPNNRKAGSAVTEAKVLVDVENSTKIQL